MRYLDTYAIHAGVQGVITRFLRARASAGAFDSTPSPIAPCAARTRTHLKDTVAAGLGVHFWKFFIDAAFELLVPGPARVVTTPLHDAAGTENETGAYKAHCVHSRIVGSDTFLISPLLRTPDSVDGDAY